MAPYFNNYDSYGDDFGNIGNNTFGDRFGQQVNDDRPTQLQKVYGSNLPPSLRYGALNAAVPAATSQNRSRTRPTLGYGNTNANANLFGSNNANEGLYFGGTDLRRRNAMANPDAASMGSRSSRRRRATFGKRPLGRKTRFDPDPLATLGELEAERERERRRLDERVGKAVVEDDVTRVEAGTRLSPTVEGEAESDDETPEKIIEVDDETSSTDGEAAKEEAVADPAPPPVVYEKIEYFSAPRADKPKSSIPIFKNEPSTNLFGNTPSAKVPVYPKIHRKYLSRQTLKYYDLPWEYDRDDRNYFIILREIDEVENEVLFDHTKRWRERRQVDVEEASSDSESGSDRVYYRRRRRARSRISVEWDSDSDMSESESVATQARKPFLVFDFDAADRGTDRSPGSEYPLEESTSESKLQPHVPKQPGKIGTTLDCVFNASYGAASQEAPHDPVDSPRIEIVPRGPISSPHALFHLSHLQQDTLDFEKFKKAVLSMRELQKVEMILNDHLGYVQRRFEHSSDIGNTGRNMDPFVNEYTHKVRNHGDVSITTICMPFICLGKNHHENVARLSFRSLLRMTQDDISRSASMGDDRKSSTAHPARTLFQSLYAKSDSRRDLNQAICHVSDQKQGHYLYVSQLWALIIEKDVLITCSTLSRKELFGDVITTQPAPSKGPESRVEKRHIRAETPDGSIWNLNLADCQTYFDFVAHFSQYTSTFATESEILYKDEVIQPHQWRDILAAAKDSTLTVKLRRIPIMFDDEGREKFLVPAFIDSDLIRAAFGLVPDVPRSLINRARVLIDASLPHPPSDYPTHHVSEDQHQASTSAYSDKRSPKGTPDHGADHDSAHREDPIKALDRHRIILGSFCRITKRRPLPSPKEVPDIAETDTGLPKFTLENFTFNPSRFVDEDRNFDLCVQVTPQIFVDSLDSLIPKWLAVEDEHQLQNPEANEPTDRVRVDHSIPLDRWRPIALATLQNGLRSAVSLFSLQQTSNDTSREAFQKLLQAVLLVSFAFHELVQVIKTLPKPKQRSIYSRILGLGDLFRTTTELEVYSITYEAMLHRIESASDEYLRLIKHCTTALLIAARVAREYTLLGPRLEQLLRVQCDKTRSRLIEEVNVSCRVIDRFMKQKRHKSQAGTITTSNVLEREAKTLVREGWDKDIALTVLKTHFGEWRISHHAKLAQRFFNRTFDKALRADPGKTINNKAAALPLDVVNILLPRILHMPVYKNQDTLHMYNQYLTELESNILTGDASREPLERLRYLKHELNAFSIIQSQQLSILSDLKEPMFADGESILESRSLYSIPHPGPRLLTKTMEHLELQNTNIRGLDALIDTLQSEAQAAVAGIQDWRDNAAVVFTVITIIFLPLSFVASVLGMNTSEIRSMTFNQWVFWASAIPFTLLVICVTLYFVEVPPLRRWLERNGILGHRKR